MACPGVEPGGCELYASLLAADLRADADLSVVTPLSDTERRHLGLFDGGDKTLPWPSCGRSDVSCGGHLLEWLSLFDKARPDRFVLVANSPIPVDRECFHSLRVAVAAAEARVPTTVVFQFVPDPCETDISGRTLAALADEQTWVCVSRHSRCQLAASTGVDAGRIRVVPNGVLNVEGPRLDGLARKALGEELGIEDDAAMVLTAARLVPSKRHEDVLLAAADLRGEGRALHLVWAGSGPRRAELTTMADDIGLSEQVHVLGFRADVPDLLAAADVVVAPTVAEGLSFAVLEAMAAGKAVVAADATSNAELVVDRHTGLLATPADPSSYAATIRSLLDDRELADRMGQAAKIRQQALFTRAGMISGARKAIFGS